jgi:hexokinase
MNQDIKLKEFLLAHGLSSCSIDSDSMISDFLSEMEKGLSGNMSSLKMIPAFVSPDKELPAGKPVIVIDAGGTNLRIALIHFSDSGEPVIEYLEKYSMPGAEKELSAGEFYNTFAEYLSPVIDRSDKIGFCFSYPADIFPDQDGKLIHWTKDIKVPDVVGDFIGKGLLEALGKSGTNKKLVLLNDTVATMLAGKAAGTGKEYATLVGFILGTGTNTAYIEKNVNITKRNDPG